MHDPTPLWLRADSHGFSIGVALGMACWLVAAYRAWLMLGST
tara:strand:- start:2744 stop:2869 length:126 start_codon:yes stop_codon:yes gene_type:complete